VHPDDDVSLAGISAALTRLDALLDRACGGEVTVAVLEGPAGIGKSALLRRFRERHPDVRTAVVNGLPWERSCAGALLERLLVADDTDTWPDMAPRGSIAADPAATGAALAHRWTKAAREKPLVVAVDDAQHADAASLQAVVSAVARLREAQFLLLLARGTGADAGGDAEVADVLDRLPAAHVRVLPLTPEQVRLVAARAAAVDLPLPVARRLCEHTAGTPRHLLEILRDTPPARWSEWQTRLPVPASVQSRVQASLDGCAASCRALVEAAAVLGPAPVLAEAAVLGDVADPVAALDEACAAGLLRPAVGHGLDVLTFPGPFAREAVHATLTPAHRHGLHLRAAEVVIDEIEQLRHRVEAAPLPDPVLADALVALARRKADDGAWAVVASALIDASRISPTRADREDRLIQAVDALAGAGLLGQAVDALPDVEALRPGPRRDAVLAYVAIQRG
jgi:AAA ATPase domain